MVRNLIFVLGLLACEPQSAGLLDLSGDAPRIVAASPASQPAGGAIPNLDPAGLPIYGTLLSRGPGRTAWLDRGRDHGVAAGEVWWLRVSGQPVARLEVAFAGPGESFGRLEPLADGVRFAPGMRFQRWYQPAVDAPLGTAVAFAEPSGEPAVWVALPPDLPARGQRVRFGPDGAGARGVLDRRDDRFGLVLLSPANGADEAAPGTIAMITPARPRDLVGRTFAPAGGAGVYVDLGRVDGLESDAVGVATLPDGTAREVAANRIHDSYSGLTVRGGGGEIPAGCRVSFAGAGARDPVSAVAEVFDGIGFVSAAGSQLSVGQRVTLSDARQVVGVGQILAVQPGGRAVGVVSQAFSLRAPEPGDLVHPVGAGEPD